MERLVKGSDDALDALMERHAGPLFGFLCRFVGDEASADDLAQEAFARVYRHRRDFREGTRFSTWLFTIAGNLARNHLRARSRRPEVPFDPGSADEPIAPAELWMSRGAGPDQQLEADERLEAVRRAVSQLPEELREPIVMCELEDLSLKDAAGILGTTVKAVESRLYRARRLLQQKLARWLEISPRR